MKSLLDELISKATLTETRDPASGQRRVVVQLPTEGLQWLADPLAGIAPEDRPAMRNLATARTFDQELAEQCLLRSLPDTLSFADLVARPYVDRVPGPGDRWQVGRRYRQDFIRSWWPAWASRGDAAGIPQGLRQLSRCLADAYAARGDELEQLYHLLAANRTQARSLFIRLFDEADRRFDLPRCHALLRILEEHLFLLAADAASGQSARDASLLGPALADTMQKRRLRLQLRSGWAPEYYETMVYLERENLRDRLPKLIKGQDHWILNLVALGGMGKSMFIRSAISRYCVPHGIPCALIDFDFVPYIAEAGSEPWRLLLRVADQLNRQLPKRPFDALLRSYREEMADDSTRAPGLEGRTAPVGPAGEDSILRDVVERFLFGIGDIGPEQPYLIIFDTLEELRLRHGDLSDAFGMLRDVHEGSRGMRLILAGREIRQEGDDDGLSPGAGGPGFLDLFGQQVVYVSIEPFDDKEARDYLEQKREMGGDGRLEAIVDKAQGNPFKLALLADIVHDNPELTKEEIEEYTAIDVVYLIERIVGHIRDDLVKWLVRYGVVPRQLTLDFVEKVLVPYIECGISGDTTLDRPGSDRLPTRVLDRKLFPTIRIAGPLEAADIWHALSQYAGTHAWVMPVQNPPGALQFHSEVLEPMRYLLQQQGEDQRHIYRELNSAAIDYCEDRAEAHPGYRAHWLAEAVYHWFQLGDPEGAAAYWRRKMDAAADDPRTAEALATEVLRVPSHAERQTVDGRTEVPEVSDQIKAVAAYELACRQLEKEGPLSRSDRAHVDHWLAEAERLNPAESPALAFAQLAHVRGRLSLHDARAVQALELARQGLRQPAGARNEMELHWLAADALYALRRPADDAEAAAHYRSALAFARTSAPRHTTAIAISAAQDLEARERYLAASAAYRRLGDEALAGGDFSRFAQHLVARIRVEAAMGRERSAVHIGEHGLDMLKDAPSKFGQASGDTLPLTAWQGVIRAETELARLCPGAALEELDLALQVAKGAQSGPADWATSPWWREIEYSLRARIGQARLDLREAVATQEKLAKDVYKPNTAEGLRALLACASLYMHLGGGLVQADGFLASVKENEAHLDIPEPLRVRRRLVGIQRSALRAKGGAARDAAAKLAGSAGAGWPASLHAQVAAELVVQTGASAAAVQRLAAALQAVRPSSRRLVLLEELRRCLLPETVSPQLAEHLLALLPQPSAAGQDPALAALRLAEVERVVGHVEAARSLLCQAREGNHKSVRLALLRQVSLAHDRLGWEDQFLAAQELPPDGDPVWERNRELGGLALLEHAERLARVLGDQEQASRLLARAHALLGDQSPWRGRMAMLRGALALAADDTETGELEWRRAVDAYSAMGISWDLAQRRAWEVDERLYGPEHRALVWDAYNLGTLLYYKDSLDGAKLALERALAMAERTLGPEHRRIPQIASFLGRVLFEMGDLARARITLERAVYLSLPGSPDLPMVFYNLAIDVRRRYARSGRLDDLGKAIEAYQQAIQLSAPDSPDLPSYLAKLGTSFHDRYARGGSPDDLERAITAYQQTVQLTPADSPDLPMVFNNLGIDLRERYARSGRLDDLRKAIEAYRQAIQVSAPDSLDLPVALTNLRNGLSDRYARTGRLEDLEEAIGVCQRAVERTPPDSPNLPSRLTILGNGLRAHYARTGRLEDLEEAIGVYQRAVERTPPDSPDQPGFLNNLGTGLRDRYARTGQLEDLEEAIGVHQRAVERTPPDSPDLPSRLTNLGNGLRDRYARTGRLEDLEEAIGVYQRAVERTPPDSPDLPARLTNLGNGLRDRYARTGRLEDLEEVIGVHQRAVERTLPDSPDLADFLNNLGTGLSDRYARTGRLEDLEEAIGVYQRAVERTPLDSPDQPRFLNNLGNGLRDRYARTGRLEDLEKAIAVSQRAVERTSPDSPDLPSRLTNLGNGLRARYAGTGRLEDLEKAIGVYQLAAEHTPPDSPDQPGFLNNLGTGLSDRYARMGRLEDLEEAIGLFYQAIERMPPHSPSRGGYLSNLGTSLRVRYAHTGDQGDLERAIRVFEQAVECTPPDSPELSDYLNNLGNGLSDRYAATGRDQDLEEAIVVYQQAIEQPLRDRPADYPAYHSNLANAYTRRIRGERADNLELAIAHYQQALQIYTPQAFPADWAMTQNNLAAAYADRIRGDRADNIELAIAHCQQALEIYTPQAFPADWAMTQNNLAAAYADRTRGDRADNLELAIAHFQQALEIYTPQAFPADWAMTQNNLAAAYADRIRGDRADNIELAIAHYQQALEVSTRDPYPEQWAGIHGRLANAYVERLQGERADNIERAIQHYELTLEVFTRDAFAARWAATQNNLANVYAQQAGGDRAENLERAIEHYEQALQVYTLETFPKLWAETQGNLGNAYAKRLLANHADNLEMAIQHYELALEVYTADAYPDESAVIRDKLANARAGRAEHVVQSSVTVDQRIGANYGTVTGIVAGSIGHGSVNIHQTVGTVAAEASMTGVRIGSLGGPEKRGADRIGGIGIAELTVAVKPIASTAWEITLRLLDQDRRERTTSRKVDLPADLRPLLVADPGEYSSRIFIKELVGDWPRISFLLGEMAFPPEWRADYLSGLPPYVLYWELEELQLAWLPWEMLRPSPTGPPLVLSPACRYVARRLPRSSGSRPVPSRESARSDVVVMGTDRDWGRRDERGYGQRASELRRLYEGRDLRVVLVPESEPLKLADLVRGLQPRVVHLLAGIHGRGQRLLLDWGEDSKMEPFSARDLANALLGTEFTPLVILDTLAPDLIHERVRQLCLRNAFTAELAFSSDAPLTILATGLADAQQRPKLLDVLVAGLAERLPAMEVTRRILALASEMQPADAWADLQTVPPLDAILPFLGTALFGGDVAQALAAGEETVTNCPRCGKPVEPLWRVCAYCGTALSVAVGRSHGVAQ